MMAELAVETFLRVTPVFLSKKWRAGGQAEPIRHGEARVCARARLQLELVRHLQGRGGQPTRPRPRLHLVRTPVADTIVLHGKSHFERQTMGIRIVISRCSCPKTRQLLCRIPYIVAQ